MNDMKKRNITVPVLALMICLAVSCTGRNIRYSEMSYRSVRFEVPESIGHSEKEFEEIELKYRKDPASSYEIVIKPYSFTGGKERIIMNPEKGFSTKLYSGSLKAAVLLVKNGSLENTEFIEVKGRDSAELLKNLGEKINRVLSD